MNLRRHYHSGEPSLFKNNSFKFSPDTYNKDLPTARVYATLDPAFVGQFADVRRALVGWRCKLDPGLKAHSFQTLIVKRDNSALSTRNLVFCGKLDPGLKAHSFKL